MNPYTIWGTFYVWCVHDFKIFFLSLQICLQKNMVSYYFWFLSFFLLYFVFQNHYGLNGINGKSLLHTESKKTKRE